MAISFTRIGLLAKKQFIDNKKLYLFGVLAMMGIMGAIFSLFLITGTNLGKENQAVYLLLGLVVFGGLYTLTLFSNLENTKGRTLSLMLPATATEKLICAFVYGAILFPLAYLLCVYPLLRFTIFIDNKFMGHFTSPYVFDEHRAQLFLITAFFLIQAQILLCSLFFKHYKAVKSIVFICVMFFGTLIIYTKIIGYILPGRIDKTAVVEERYYKNNNLFKTDTVKRHLTADTRIINLFTAVKYYGDQRDVSLELTRKQKNVFFLLLYLTIPCMWLISWVRLKEMEVN
ncbi:hypothetical protein [Pelobium manganitolerans]|uniref:hypothetical protein n=1 Tax=Pelobium manganitolerans TaxID=1842495 RepID=UPI003FA3CF2D